MNQTEIILIQDTREQAGYQPLFRSPCVIQGLELGDYSVVGLEDLISLEKKSLPDLLGSITGSRARFEHELKKARTLHRFYVVIESDPATILRGNYPHSKAHPNAVWATICSWSSKYAPFLFAGNREHAAKLVEGILLQYAQQRFKTVLGMKKASKAYSAGQAASVC